MASIKKIEGINGTTYKVTVFAGRDENGKQKRQYRTYAPSDGMTQRQIEKELNKFVVDFEKEVEQGFTPDNKQMFSKYADYVLELKKVRNNTKHRTISRYSELLERINPVIGYLKLSEIRPQHLNNFYTSLSKNGQNKRTQGKLSNKTILEHHRLISTVLEQAFKEGYITTNPAKRAMPPAPDKQEAKSFDISDIENIKTALETDIIAESDKYKELQEKYPDRNYINPRNTFKWKVAIYLLMTTGCRRGDAYVKHKLKFFSNIFSTLKKAQSPSVMTGSALLI